MTNVKVTTDKDGITIRGESTRAVTIQPTAENEYAPVRWLDQEGNNVAMIVAHEKSSGGSVHNHLSIYTAKADRSQRISRIDLTFGVDKALLSFEDVTVEFKGGNSELVLRSPDGSRWCITVADDGTISAMPA